MTACFMAGVLVLVLRLVWIQFIKGAKYKTLAAEQQTRDSTISAKRGSIYDRNMKVLAQSASAERITINPQEIKKAKNAGKVTKALVSVLGADRSAVKAKIAKTDRQSEVIAKTG